MSFHSLIACLFLVLNNIPLSGVTVYFSIHLLKNIFVASRFWQLQIKTCTGVYVDIKFSVHLGKYQGMQLLDHMVRVSFCKKLLKCLPKLLYHFVLPLAENKSSCYATS